MTTLSHQTFSDRALSLRSAVSASPASGFERSLAQASSAACRREGAPLRRGRRNHHVYRIETGAIALFRVLADGRRQVMGFAYPGDMIGLGMEDEHEMNAQAVKPTRLRCLPVSSVHQTAAKDPMLGFKLYQALARELAATRDLMLTTGHRSAIERVAGFLLASPGATNATARTARRLICR